MKIKEGGGMDIQKVKELALVNGFKLKEQASGNMDLNAYVYDFANAVEREVKAQSDQKIKLLLCDEHLKKCESPTGVFNSQYSAQGISFHSMASSQSPSGAGTRSGNLGYMRPNLERCGIQSLVMQGSKNHSKLGAC